MLADLGGSKHALIMRNHGMLSIGATLGEAFGCMRALIDACALQMKLMATGRKMRPIPAELQTHTKAQMNGRLGNAPRDDIPGTTGCGSPSGSIRRLRTEVTLAAASCRTSAVAW